MREVVSVIIPVYNAEKYLRECIDSVIKQSYKNIEIVLIDDGSTDGSSGICDEYAARDSRICVIHQENGGLSAARNTGIERCTGEYLLFIDSDDIIHSEMIKCLYEVMISMGADLSFCKYRTFHDSREIGMSEIARCHTESMSGREAVGRIYSRECADYIIACSKLYKRSCFDELRFPLGKKHEDEFITYRILYPLKKCIFIKDEMYYYRMQNNSITHSRNIRHYLDVLEALEQRLEFFIQKKDRELYDLTLKEYELYLIKTINYIYGHQMAGEHQQQDELLRELRGKFKDKLKNEVRSSRIDRPSKIRFRLFLINRRVYCALMDILGLGK